MTRNSTKGHCETVSFISHLPGPNNSVTHKLTSSPPPPRLFILTFHPSLNSTKSTPARHQLEPFNSHTTLQYIHLPRLISTRYSSSLPPRIMGCFDAVTRESSLTHSGNFSLSSNGKPKRFPFCFPNARSSPKRRSGRRKKFYTPSFSPSSTISSRGDVKYGERKPDRIGSDSSMESTVTTEPFVERLIAPPEEDREIKPDVVRRESSFVLSKVNQYNQLHAKSTLERPLIELKGTPMTPKNSLYERVQSFEDIAKRNSEKAVGPTLEELHRRRDSRLSRKSSLSVESNPPEPTVGSPVVSQLQRVQDLILLH